MLSCTGLGGQPNRQSTRRTGEADLTLKAITETAGFEVSGCYTRRMWRRKSLRLAATSISGLLAVAVIYGAIWYYRPFAPRPSPLPSPATTLEDRRVQDLNYLTENLERLHPDMFFKVSPKTFHAAVTDLKGQIARFSNADFAIGLTQLVALIGDGHTTVSFWEPGLHTFPISLQTFPEGTYVTVAAPWERELLGLKLLAVDGQPISDVSRKLSSVISADNDAALQDQLPELMTISEILHYRGISASDQRATFTFATDRKKRLKATLVGLPLDEPVSYDDVRKDEPISRIRQDEPFWFQYLPAQHALYFQYNSCIDPARFKTFAKTLIATTKTKPVERIVIDLRYNGGGNSAQFGSLLRWLKRSPFNHRGGIVVLIGHGTYSSALWNAIDLKRNTQAVLMGEPTGGKPNSFGEVRTFTLPNSGLTVGYSTRNWHRFPELGDASSLEPDLLVQEHLKPYLAGRDTVLERAFSWREPSSRP